MHCQWTNSERIQNETMQPIMIKCVYHNDQLVFSFHPRFSFILVDVQTTILTILQISVIHSDVNIIGMRTLADVKNQSQMSSVTHLGFSVHFRTSCISNNKTHQYIYRQWTCLVLSFIEHVLSISLARCPSYINKTKHNRQSFMLVATAINSI
jgi:hypothetical protein